MEISTFMRRVGALMISASLASCQAGVPAGMQAADQGAFVLDRAAAIERLAAPGAVDWSVGRINNVDVAHRKNDLEQQKPASYALKALTTATSIASNSTTATTGFPGTGGGAISSSPAFHYLTDKAYWLTDSGYLLSNTIPSSGAGTPTASTGAAWQVKNLAGTNQTFKNTQISMSNDGKRIYLTSLQGNFLVIDATNGTCLYSYSMGTNASITATGGGANLPPDTCPAPFIDPLASLPNGRAETVYAVANSGTATSSTTTLYRFVIGYNPAAASPDPQVSGSMAQSYNLGLGYTAPYLEGVRTSPIVIAGRAVIGTWRRHNTTANLDVGSVLYYDTQCRSLNGGTVAGAAQVTKTGVPNPVWAPVALDVDNSFVPYLAFVAGSYQVTAVDVRTSTLGNSPPLLVDKKTVPTTDSAGATISPAGSLSNYPYDSTGIQTKTVAPVQSPAGTYSAVAVSEAATKNLYDSSGNNLGITVDNTRFFSYSSQTTSDATQVAAYGYVKFLYTTADRYYGTETSPRSVNKIRFKMRATINSNCGCVGGGSASSSVAGMNGWAVKSTLTSGTDWTVANMTPATRPTFANGDTFTYTNASKNVHAGEKLVPDTGSNNTAAANSFKSNTVYGWLADGLIAENVTQTFAFYDDNAQDGASKNPGKPFNVGTPYFEGATSGNRPYLELELSANGLGNPSMLCPVTIDSLYQQIYAVNTNALYRISYEPFVNTGYTSLALPERFTSMADTQKTFYAHTYLGSHASYGPIFTHTTAPTKRYVSNITAPLLTLTRVYVMDNFASTSGVSNRTTINEFSFGTYPTVTLGTGSPPVLQGSLDLTAAQADAQAGSTYMVYDYESLRLLAGTYTPGTTTGRAWVLNR